LTRVEQVKNILEVAGTIQRFGKKVRLSDGLLAPAAIRASRSYCAHVL